MGNGLGDALALAAGKPTDYSGLRMQKEQIEYARNAQREAGKAKAEADRAKELADASAKWEKDVHVEPNLYHKVYQPEAKKIYADYLDKAYRNWKSGNGNMNAQLALETNFALQPLLQNSDTAFKIRDGYLKGDFTNRAAYEALESGDINKVKATPATAYGQWGGMDEKGNISARQWKKYDYDNAFKEQNLAKEEAFGAIGTIIPNQIKNIQVIKSATLANVYQKADAQFSEPGQAGDSLRSDIYSTHEDAFKKIIAAKGLPATDMDIRDPNSESGKMFIELGKEAWRKQAEMHVEKDIEQRLLHLNQPKSDGNGSGGGKKGSGVTEITETTVGIESPYGTSEYRYVKGYKVGYPQKEVGFQNPSGKVVFHDSKTGKRIDVPGYTKAQFSEDVLELHKPDGTRVSSIDPDNPYYHNGKLVNGVKWVIMSYGTTSPEKVATTDGKTATTSVNNDFYVDNDVVYSSLVASMGDTDAADYAKKIKELRVKRDEMNGVKAAGSTGNVDAVLQSNKAVPFVDRMLNPDKYPVRPNKDGSVSTHKMAWGESDGKYVVFPTLFIENGKYIEPKDPFKYAMNKKDVIFFDTQKEAEEFAAGSWKKSGLIKSSKAGTGNKKVSTKASVL